MKNNLVSIIIPCYNQAQYLEESVRSAIEQTYPNIEIIIVNDGSSDDTEQIALKLKSKYPKKIKVISQKNSGVSEARNNAIEQSKGNYILPLDSDDLISPRMVDYCIRSMIDTNSDIVYTNVQCFGKYNWTIEKLPFSMNNILYENLCHNTSLYKKKVWKKTEGYAGNMKEGYEDWEFWINAYKHGFKFQLLSEPLILYRTQEVSRNTEAENKDAYLKAKIALNHPELYTIDWVDKAIEIIKKTETLPDYYFYGPKNMPIEEKILANALNHYLVDNKLDRKQLINIPGTSKKITLYALDLMKSRNHLKHLINKKETDLILFYTTLRYKVSGLKNLNFIWGKTRGITEIHGSIFPFVFRPEREKYQSQLIAYNHLLNYQNKKYAKQSKQQEEAIRNKIKTVEKQEERIQEKNRLLEKKDEVIENFKKQVEQYKAEGEQTNKILEEMSKELHITNLKYGAITESLSKVIRYSALKKPVDKYRAYKHLIQIYEQNC